MLTPCNANLCHVQVAYLGSLIHNNAVANVLQTLGTASRICKSEVTSMSLSSTRNTKDCYRPKKVLDTLYDFMWENEHACSPGTCQLQ